MSEYILEMNHITKEFSGGFGNGVFRAVTIQLDDLLIVRIIISFCFERPFTCHHDIFGISLHGGRKNVIAR